MYNYATKLYSATIDYVELSQVHIQIMFQNAASSSIRKIIKESSPWPRTPKPPENKSKNQKSLQRIYESKKNRRNDPLQIILWKIKGNKSGERWKTYDKHPSHIRGEFIQP